MSDKIVNAVIEQIRRAAPEFLGRALTGSGSYDQLPRPAAKFEQHVVNLATGAGSAGTAPVVVRRCLLRRRQVYEADIGTRDDGAAAMAAGVQLRRAAAPLEGIGLGAGRDGAGHRLQSLPGHLRAPAPSGHREVGHLQAGHTINGRHSYAISPSLRVEQRDSPIISAGRGRVFTVEVEMVAGWNCTNEEQLGAIIAVELTVREHSAALTADARAHGHGTSRVDQRSPPQPTGGRPVSRLRQPADAGARLSSCAIAREECADHG